MLVQKLISSMISKLRIVEVLFKIMILRSFSTRAAGVPSRSWTWYLLSTLGLHRCRGPFGGKQSEQNEAPAEQRPKVGGCPDVGAL